MQRFVPVLATAVLLAACSDSVTAPKSVHPTDASFALKGNPPPPPVVSEGFVDGDITPDAGLVAANGFAIRKNDVSGANCTTGAHIDFPIQYSYFANKEDLNAILRFGPIGDQHQVTIHQTFNQDLTSKKIDAHGTLDGPDFQFNIDDATAGAIINPDQEGRVPFAANVEVTGTLVTQTGSCHASGRLNVFLRGNDN